MQKKSNKKKGLQFEEIVAKMLDKYTLYKVENKTIGSGCFWHSKGDLEVSKRGSRYLLEIKGTEKKEYRLSSKIIEKIWNEALDSGKLPLFVVLIEGERERRLCVMEIGLSITNLGIGKKTVLLNSTNLDSMMYKESIKTIEIQSECNLWNLNCEVFKEGK